MEKILKIVFPIWVFLVSLGVYVFTLSPSITTGDSTEMVNASLVLGIPHQPSYPLYIVLGHFFSILPFGKDAIWRVNFFSAFFESLTCVLIYFIILKLASFPFRIWSSFLAASASLFLGFSLTFWQYGTKAEVFAFNNFLVSLLILTIFIFLEKKRNIWLFLSALVGGIALTHHQTAILVFPAIFFLIWTEDKEILKKKRFWFKSLVFSFPAFWLYYFLLTRLAAKDPPLNWGNPVNLRGVLRALMRADYGTFSAYLTGFSEKSTTFPVNQIEFYLKSLISDFTVFGVILAVIGAFYLFKEKRRIFWFLILGFGMGVFFLSYANFPLSDAFHQATTKRFQLLPNLFFGLFLGFGLFFLWEKFQSLKLDFREKSNLFAGGIVFLGLGFSFLFPLLINFSKADGRNNLLTIKYALDFYLPTEPNAIIMLSGDPSVFAANFVKTTISKDQRIVFSPGQFHLSWFLPQLKGRYPDLEIPPPLPGRRFTTTSQVIKANLGKRPIYINPELVFYDPEIEKEFVLWPKNLLFKVRRKGGEEKLENYREETQKLWESLDLSLFSKVRKMNPLMEDLIIGYYARHFHNLGYMFETVKLYDDAIREYKRAIEIDPYFADSLRNLGVVYGLKKEPPDFQKGVEYLNRFISVAGKEREKEVESAYYTIRKILEEEAKMATASAQSSSSAGLTEEENLNKIKEEKENEN